jgi:ParB-like chromosome segregation protein Spo0J
MSRRDEQINRFKKTKAAVEEEMEKNPVALDQLEVVYVDVDTLNPNSYNPNRQTDKDFQLLLSSMKDDGFTQPVIAIRSNREIVDGEHRWRAAIALGMKQIPVVFTDMTPEQQRISTLRHNRARGSEDMNLSAELLRDLASRGAADFAMESLQMSEAEMDFLLKDVKAPDMLEAPEVMKAMAESPFDQTAISDAHRVAEKRLAAESVAQDRSFKAMDLDIFRVDLSFVTEEWWIVKPALGKEPAKALLALCREQIALSNEEVPA